MSVNWYELVTPEPPKDDDPDEIIPGWDEALDETAASMRCLVYYVLIPALITMLLLGIAGGAIIANELGG